MMSTSQFAGQEEKTTIHVVRDRGGDPWPIVLTVAADGGENRIFLDDVSAADLHGKLGAAIAKALPDPTQRDR